MLLSRCVLNAFCTWFQKLHPPTIWDVLTIQLIRYIKPQSPLGHLRRLVVRDMIKFVDWMNETLSFSNVHNVIRKGEKPETTMIKTGDMTVWLYWIYNMMILFVGCFAMHAESNVIQILIRYSALQIQRKMNCLRK